MSRSNYRYVGTKLRPSFMLVESVFFPFFRFLLSVLLSFSSRRTLEIVTSVQFEDVKNANFSTISREKPLYLLLDEVARRKDEGLLNGSCHRRLRRFLLNSTISAIFNVSSNPSRQATVVGHQLLAVLQRLQDNGRRTFFFVLLFL